MTTDVQTTGPGHRTRRTTRQRRQPWLSALAVAVVAWAPLAACAGDDDPSPDAGDTSTTAPEPAATTEPATTDPATTEPATTEPATTEPATTEPVTTEPADDRRVVALDELTALSLVSIGVTPDIVLTTLDSEAFAAVSDTIDAEVVDFDVAEPSIEQLASFEADLLVGLANPNISNRVADYEAVAPTVLAPLEATWQEQLQVLAAEFDATERADAVITTVAERTADVASSVDAEAPGLSVSVLTGRVGAVLAVNASGAVGTLLSEVGVTRPEPQLAPGAPGIPFVPVAGEQLTAHDADVLLLAVGEVFDVSPITGSPLYSGMDAVASGAVHEVVGDHWVLGGSGFASWWMLADVEALLAGDEPATIDETSAQWAEFLEATA